MNRFQIFAPDGTFLETWGEGGQDTGQFDFDATDWSYGGIAFDHDGNFYVADIGNHRIQKFDRNRNFVQAWDNRGQYLYPYSIAVDGQGNVYVGDNSRGEIEKFDGSGQLLGVIGSKGEQEGQFRCIGLISVDAEGNLYVPDCRTNRIQKFGPNGEFLMAWGSEGSGDGQFESPSHAVVDASGNVYVSDEGNYRVQVFDSAGNFIDKWTIGKTLKGHWGGIGGVALDFHALWGIPIGLALDGQGNIYVVDVGAGSIKKFHLEPPHTPEGIPKS